MKRGQKTVHLRKVRCRTRVVRSEESNQKVQQVLTLCGEWYAPGNTVREDQSLVTDADNLCDECIAQRSLGDVFGDDDDTEPSAAVAPTN